MIAWNYHRTGRMAGCETAKTGDLEFFLTPLSDTEYHLQLHTGNHRLAYVAGTSREDVKAQAVDMAKTWLTRNLEQLEKGGNTDAHV